MIGRDKVCLSLPLCVLFICLPSFVGLFVDHPMSTKKVRTSTVTRGCVFRLIRLKQPEATYRQTGGRGVGFCFQDSLEVNRERQTTQIFVFVDDGDKLDKIKRRV